MATITPDEGLEITFDKLLNDDAFDDWEIFQIAVGDGTANLSNLDTQLDNELYRANKDDSVVSIEDSSQPGKITVRLSLSGGTEVPAGSDITEFGIWAIDPTDRPVDGTTDAKDRMLHRELRNAITLDSGDRRTFEIEYIAGSR